MRRSQSRGWRSQLVVGVLGCVGHDDEAQALAAHKLAYGRLVLRCAHVVVPARVQLVAQAHADSRVGAKRARIDEQVTVLGRDRGF